MVTQSLELLLHLASASLALATAVWAAYLIPLTGKSKAWLLFSTAMVLIAVNLLLELFAHTSLLLAERTQDILNDILHVALPILLLGSIFYIRDIFLERQVAQRKLEQQLDELQRFHEITIGRELRMKALSEENQALKAGVVQTTDAQDRIPSPQAVGNIPQKADHTKEEQERTALLFLLEDLETGRKQTEATHQEWIASMDAIHDPIFMHDRDFRVMRSNRAYAEHAGMSVKEVIGKLYYEVFPKLDGPLPHCRNALHGEGEKGEEIPLPNGEVFQSRSFSVRNDNGRYLYSLHIMEDITERKKSELAVQHANRAFKTLSACNHELVHASDETQLLHAMCRVIVEDGGYQAAWVGYKQDDAEKTVRPMARGGFEAGYAESMQITWADSERGQGPTGKAIRSGTTQVVQDVSSDPACAPWREQATQRNNTSGNASAIALPLFEGTHILGCLSIYAAQVNAFDPKEIALLEEMADDLAFGIRMLRLRQAQKRHTSELRKGLEGTIEAIAGMVEMRDPYTAGHQQRVAQLASAIAVEMGLPEEQVHGIHLAGTIHDLGKIQTPAEILSKPGKLSEIEYQLIKEHAHNGYEILKDIDFSWPIAQMVWQHHEKLDGSGYPQGLKGNDILLEARILTVADVVEAMSSHRPYRPGLGLDAALKEVTRGRGTHYDPDAVDVCVRLFREKEFKFE